MLKIGEFSRLSQVTVKTLHHYDETGLLVPAHIDRFTKHRYYSVDQLRQIHRIMALKGLGLSLEQIGLVLSERLDVQQVHGMLRLKQSELQERLREEQAQLAQVEFRLRMLEMEDNMPELGVMVKSIAPMRALTLRRSVRDAIASFSQELQQALAEHAVKLTGPATEIRYADEFMPTFEDVELVLPVDERQTQDVSLATLGTLKLTTVPGLQLAATFMHQGAHTQPIDEDLLVLQRWIVANGYTLGGSNRLVHHRGWLDHADYKDWITEIQHQIVSEKPPATTPALS
jgi:DNA-binding transcriptional MerR regulator